MAGRRSRVRRPGRRADLVHEGAPSRRSGGSSWSTAAPGARVLAGDLEIEVARRSGYLIRVHDPKAWSCARSTASRRTSRPVWVFRARFEPFDAPRPTTVGAVVEGLSHVYTAAGPRPLLPRRRRTR